MIHVLCREGQAVTVNTSVAPYLRIQFDRTFTKIVSIWGSTPEPSRRAHSAPPKPTIAGFCGNRPLQRILVMSSKVIYIAPNITSFFILKCTKIIGVWGSAPDPAGGAYSALPYSLAALSWNQERF